MFSYFAFGRVIRSEIPLATLAPCPPQSVAHLQVERRALGARDARFVPVGTDPHLPCDLKLWRLDSRWRFEHACSGVYELDTAQRTICCDVPASLAEESLRLDLVGRMLPLAVHDAGELCLHASAVSLGERAVLFAAVKGTGKSSLAAALVASGAPLVGDDAVAVRVGEEPTAYTGSLALRIRSDTMQATGRVWENATETIDGKYSIDDVAREGNGGTATAPVSAVYLIEPAPADAPHAATRERLSGFAAAVQLQPHGKLGTLLQGTEADRQFRHTLALTARVPAYTLRVARDLARLPDVVQIVRGWHS